MAAPDRTGGGLASLGSLGLTIPLDAPLAAHRDLLPRLFEAGYAEFWTAETAGVDAFTPLAYGAAVAERARFGTAIASVFTRGPAVLAMTAAGLAEAAPGRFSLGLGAASPVIVGNWNATAYDRPLARVRDTLRFLRTALAGERVDAEYETFAVRGFRLERVPETPPPLLIAALRPAMLQLAGESADGVVLNWLSADDVRQVLPHVGATGGPAHRVVTRLFVCPSDDADTVRTAARRLIAGYLTVPAYAAFHRWLGREDALGETWRLWAAGERKAAAAAVPDSVVDELIIHGDPASCAAHVARYVEAGVDVPVLKFLPLAPGRDALADALAVAAAARTLA